MEAATLFSPEFAYSDECLEVSFRVDFYSLKDFVGKFQMIAGDIIGNFSERLLTDEEGQRLDVISVAANLENSTNEIMNRKAFIFNWADDKAENNRDITQVIVSPYFIFVYCRGNKDRINSIVARFDKIASYLPSLSEEISMIGMRFSSRFLIYAEADYFPFMGLSFYDPEKLNNASQSHETIFNENEEEGNEIISKINSKLKYIRIEDTKEIIGNVNLSAHSYSGITCPDKECLIAEFGKLVSVTEKYIGICAE